MYDSVYDTVHDETAGVIINIFDIQDKAQIKQKMIQKQIGSSDCGLFAIAVATLLLHNPSVDMSSINFCQQQMRDHMLVCFQVKSLTPFPTHS